MHKAVVDPGKVSDIIRDCAQRLILPRFNNLQDGEIHTKSNAEDFCTIADTETEAELDRILCAMFPDSVLIGEEGVSQKRMTLDTLNEKDRLIWVADPVDGTRNFKNGNDKFACMLALVLNGETVMGWIYDPLNDSMMVAEKGAGAHMDGRRLSVAPPVSLADATGHAVHSLRPMAGKAGINPKQWECFYCSGHEYRYLADGKGDFALASHMTAWDHLPGVLAVQESGGVACKWDGSPYRPQDDKGGLIVASCRDLMETILRYKRGAGI